MIILSALFRSDPAAEICFGSIVFLLIYLAGFLLFQKWSRISARVPVLHRHLIPGLSAALAATAVGFWLHAANTATASARGQMEAATPMSAQELHHSVKAKSLPIQRFTDHTLVFPNPD